MVSVIIPSVRDYRWKDILEGFSSTKTEFEIVVCGPCSPQNLGPNFRAIQTNVKATQCIEIGVRQSKGEYLFFMADDLDPTPNILDTFLDYHLSCRDNLVILSPTFRQLGLSFPIEAHCFPGHRPGNDVPVMPCGLFISRRDWDTIGGIDRNFVKGFWDLDVAMRCWSLGGKTILLPDLFIDEVLPDLPHTAKANTNASHHLDMPYLLSLWTDGAVGASPGRPRTTRAKPVEPFSNDNILDTDQGVPDTNRGISQGFDAVLAEYIRTGRSPGCRNLR